MGETFQTVFMKNFTLYQFVFVCLTNTLRNTQTTPLAGGLFNELHKTVQKEHK